MATHIDPKAETFEPSDPEPRKDPDNPSRDHRNHHPEIEDDYEDDDIGYDMI
jgi:hypothetical protein